VLDEVTSREPTDAVTLTTQFGRPPCHIFGTPLA
jgi:hypothetical protein